MDVGVSDYQRIRPSNYLDEVKTYEYLWDNQNQDYGWPDWSVYRWISYDLSKIAPEEKRTGYYYCIAAFEEEADAKEFCKKKNENISPPVCV